MFTGGSLQFMKAKCHRDQKAVPGAATPTPAWQEQQQAKKFQKPILYLCLCYLSLCFLLKMIF
jgi:hypothetical protein